MPRFTTCSCPVVVVVCFIDFCIYRFSGQSKLRATRQQKQQQQLQHQKQEQQQLQQQQ